MPQLRRLRVPVLQQVEQVPVRQVVGICQLPGQRQGPAHGRTPE